MDCFSVQFISKDWDIVGLLQGSKRPLPRKLRKKSEKGFLGLLGPGVKKARKKSKTSQKPPKNLKNCRFRLFFAGSLAPEPRGPENPFSFSRKKRCPKARSGFKGPPNEDPPKSGLRVSARKSGKEKAHKPRGPKDQKNSRFRARLKISSEPPTAALFCVGKSRRRD